MTHKRLVLKKYLLREFLLISLNMRTWKSLCQWVFVDCCSNQQFPSLSDFRQERSICHSCYLLVIDKWGLWAIFSSIGYPGWGRLHLSASTIAKAWKANMATEVLTLKFPVGSDTWLIYSCIIGKGKLSGHINFPQPRKCTASCPDGKWKLFPWVLNDQHTSE